MQQKIPAERLKAVLAYIEANGSAQIRELADNQSVSEATVRRDLDELEKSGFIQRTHGGAMLLDQGASFERIYNDKMNLNLAEKRRIGAAAAVYAKEGSTIFLDSGTTSLQVALQLCSVPNLTIITHDLYIAAAVKFHPTTTVIVTGGIKREGYNLLVGSLVENFIRDLRVDVVFLTADAVDIDFGVSNANYIEAGIKTALSKVGKQIILTADATKFGKTAVARVCPLDRVHLVITDDALSEDIKARLAALRTELELV